ncbi:MAG TPA: hypothetical protein VEV83_14120 [Parafilimonas sp.]|nr:hypothetical protein [Parafilimonas sp.]
MLKDAPLDAACLFTDIHYRNLFLLPGWNTTHTKEHNGHEGFHLKFTSAIDDDHSKVHGNDRAI